MINIITLTVLFTLLGVSLVTCLVWLVVTSWNTKKLSKNNENEILETNKQIDSLNNHIFEELELLIKSTDEKFNDVYSRMDSRFDKLESKINK